MAQNAVILEFKVCGKNETADEAAKRALKQINDRDYASKAREDGYKNTEWHLKVKCAMRLWNNRMIL